MQQVILEADDEGQVTLSSEEGAVVTLLPSFFVANELFDETRVDFHSYGRECYAVESIIHAILQARGYTIAGNLHQALYKMCAPGPPVAYDPADYVFTLVKEES